MELAIPLGLLGLLGIIALIIIYILKPKYKRADVSSTYIWKLSLKYVKKKVPIQWLQNSILIILQVLILAIIAFMLSGPMAVQAVPGNSGGEKIVILDAGAAMTTIKDGRTRFGRALDEISSLAETTAANGDRFSVILASDEPTVLVERSLEAPFVLQALSGAKPFYGEADIDAALGLAGKILDKNPNAEVVFYTDREYESTTGVTVKNMSSSEWNAAILSFESELVNGRYEFTASVASYNRDIALAVELQIDGRYFDAKIANCVDGGAVTLTWQSGLSNYADAELILKPDREDALTHDNNFFINHNEKSYRIHYVAPSYNLFFGTMLSFEGTVVRPGLIDPENPPMAGEETMADYNIETTGYDLYVFEEWVPAVMPTDGTVWLINPDPSISDNSAGLNSAGLTLGTVRQDLINGFIPVPQGGETPGRILDGVDANNLWVTRYVNITGFPGYTSVLNYGSGAAATPSVLIREPSAGKAKTVVTAFGTGYTDPRIGDFPLLFYNLLNYSLVPNVSDNLITAGETVEINALPQTTRIEVSSVNGNSVFTSFPVILKADNPGLYTVTQYKADNTVADETEIFAKIPETESNFKAKGPALAAASTPGAAYEDGEDGTRKYDIFFWLAVAFLVIFFVEWWLQYREQF